MFARFSNKTNAFSLFGQGEGCALWKTFGAGLIILSFFLLPSMVVAQDDGSSGTFHQSNPIKLDSSQLKELMRLQKAYAYQGPGESLSKAIQTIEQDIKEYDPVANILTYSYLGKAFAELDQYEKALVYYQEALKLQQTIGDSVGAVRSFDAITVIQTRLSEYEDAIKTFEQEISYCTALNDPICKIRAYFEIGSLYMNYLLQYDKGMESHVQSLKLAREVDDTLYVVKNLRQIGYIQYAKKDFKLSLDYYEQAAELARRAKLYEVMYDIYTYLANLHGELGNEELEMVYYNRVLEQEDDDSFEKINGRSLHSIGMYYARLKDYQKALHYYQMALSKFKAHGNHRWTSYVNAQIGQLLIEQGRLDSAQAYITRGIAIAEHYRLRKERYDNYEAMSEVMQARGDHERALLYFKQYMALKDSVFTLDIQSNIDRLQDQLDNEARQKKIDLLEKETELADQRQIRNMLIAGVLIICLIAIGLYNRSNYRKKTNLALANAFTKIEEKNLQITDSINYARKIQDAIMTSDGYMKKALPNSFILYQPKDILSGDFYWAYQPADGKVIFSVADCTGHGVPGALMSIIGNFMLNEVIIENNIEDPAEVLGRLKDNIIKSLKQTGEYEDANDGMDMVLAVWHKPSKHDLSIDPDGRGVLEFAGAYNPMYIVRPSNEAAREVMEAGEDDMVKAVNAGYELLEFKGDNLPIGYSIHKDKSFSRHEFPLRKGDTIYLFTDGYVDQFGGKKRKKFGYKSFRSALLEIQGLPLAEQKESLAQILLDWQGDVPQVDDILVMGIRID